MSSGPFVRAVVISGGGTDDTINPAGLLPGEVDAGAGVPAGAVASVSPSSPPPAHPWWVGWEVLSCKGRGGRAASPVPSGTVEGAFAPS